MSAESILKSSAQKDKEILATQIAFGEIALNYHETGPFLQCKDRTGAIWRVGGVIIDENAPVAPGKAAWWYKPSLGKLSLYTAAGWKEISRTVITDSDIDPSADIAVSKLAHGLARQLLQTNSNGTDTEWTSNVDIPGTLDVTQAATFDSNVVIAGNLTVNGTTTTIDTTTLLVEDKNIEMGVVPTPTDVTADGGGITLKGTTDKTLNWVNATDSWTSSEHVNLASGKSYRINNVEVLTATGLGPTIQISGANIPDGTIVNSDISDTAEIAVNKLADGSARQLLQTDAAGTGVEWTSNVDIPGTLDVTGIATFDNHVAVTGNLTKGGNTVVTVGDIATVTSTMIVDGAIVDADINASAAISGSKIQAGSTSAAGAVQLSDSTSSTSTSLAATANAVKTTYDLANAAMPQTGGTFTGDVTLGATRVLIFEGSTDDTFETTLTVADPTADRTITLPNATGTVALTSDLSGYGLLDGAQTWTKGQRGEITALTDGATITPDFSDSNNFSVTLGGNRTLANPTNLVAGQSGCIWITQDGTGGRTLAYGSYWDFTGGTAPTVTSTASARSCLVYAVQSTTQITATLITNLS